MSDLIEFLRARLDEVEAKRLLLDWLDVTERDFHACDGIKSNVRLARRALALPYSDHPDYREEWKP